VEPETVTDLSGRWNDTDSRLVANALIEQSLGGAWIGNYSTNNAGESPTVIVGSFHNRTSEHVPVNTFVHDLEIAFVNSGAVSIVAGSEEREEIRDERSDQQEFARADTRARLGQELGANYILQGELQSIEDEEETVRLGLTRKEKIVFYQVDARLIDLETNIVVWAGQHEIKKYIERKPLGL
jgi:TolB-like protein